VDQSASARRTTLLALLSSVGVATLASVATAPRAEGLTDGLAHTATGVIAFEHGYRIEVPDHTPPTPEWTTYQVSGVMQLHLLQDGYEWVDTGSTYSLVAIEVKAPYWSEAECEVRDHVTAAQRTGPLVTASDGIRLVVDAATGMASLDLSVGTTPGTLGSRASLYGECQNRQLERGFSGTTGPEGLGQGSIISCTAGTLDAAGTTILFRHDGCARFVVTERRYERDITASSLSGRIRLSPCPGPWSTDPAPSATPARPSRASMQTATGTTSPGSR
jgi:hypothetical protein